MSLKSFNKIKYLIILGESYTVFFKFSFIRLDLSALDLLLSSSTAPRILLD